MLLTGLIRNIFPEEIISIRFRKRICWLTEINKQYAQTWAIEFFNDDGKWLDKYKTGDLVNVNIAIIGKLSERNGEEKVWNTIRGIKIEKVK